LPRIKISISATVYTTDSFSTSLIYLLPIKAPKTNRLRQMLWANLLLAIHIRDGAGQF